MNTFTILKNRIAQYRTRKKSAAFLEHSLQFLFYVLLFFLALPILYKIGKSDPVYRWLLSLGTGATVLYFGWKKVIQPLLQLVIFRNTPSIEQAALEIGQAFNSIKDELSNSVQLLHDPQNKSNPFALAAFKRILARTKDLNFKGIISYRFLKKSISMNMAVVALAAILVPSFSQSYFEAVHILLQPHHIPTSQVIKFEVSPGDDRIARGESLEIFVIVQGEFEEPPVLILNKSAGPSNRVTMTPGNGAAHFRHSLENINTSFNYQIALEHAQSPTFYVDVIDLPEIREQQLYIHPPAYTLLPTDTLEKNIGDAAVFPGSLIAFVLMPNKKIVDAQVTFSSGDTLQMQKNASDYLGQLRIMKPMTYSFLLEDEYGLGNRAPIEYTISLKEDLPPTVQIDTPGKDMDLDESMEIPLRILGEDDFGFSKLVLNYRLIKKSGLDTSGLQTKNLTYKTHDGVLLSSTIWDLASVEVFPEDVVEYFVRLYDNDNVSGPKFADSKTYRLRLPSIQELFAESEATQDEAGSSIDEIYENSQEIQERMEDVLQNIRRNQEVKWEDEQVIKESISKQKEMLQELEQVKQDINEMMDTLDKNDMLALETLEKYQELQELLDKVASPELKKMMEKLQNAMQKRDAKKMQEALENIQLSQEDFIKSMEKTINLLKQLEAEQKLDEAIQLTEEMIEKQQEINESLAEKNSEKGLEKSAQEQEKQSETLNDVQNAMNELQQSASELPQMQLPTDQLSQAQNQAEQAAHDMQNAMQNMQSGQQQKSMQSGQRVSEQLQQ
ncbi:MAG: hypothetical protein DWQ10_01105, partial [Calditrichaeota bacterium]